MANLFLLHLQHKPFLIFFLGTAGVLFDYDSDGYLDIFVANWAAEPYPNFLYHNEGNGRFRDIAEQTPLHRLDYSDGIALGLDVYLHNEIAVVINYNQVCAN